MLNFSYNFLPYCKKCINGYFVNLEGKCQNGNEDNTNGCYSFKAFGKNGYKCGGCIIGYFFNNGICLKINETELNNCRTIENIGTQDNIILSCSYCNYNYILAIKENNVQICIVPNQYDNLQNCDLCRKEVDHNFVCIKCKYSFSLNIIKGNKTMCINDNSIAGCDNYYIENNEIKCKSCKNGYSLISSNNCLKCEEKCEICYLDNNNIIQCKKYVEPYFFNNSIIEKCFDYLDKNIQCSYSSDMILKCDKCHEDFFLNKNGICQHCYINKKINEACISCTDDEEIKS